MSEHELQPMTTPPPPLRVVFLGTPNVVVCVGDALLASNDVCELVAVVTAPPARRGRGSGASSSVPTPVGQWAEAKAVPCETPESARDPEFLSRLAALEPDVCVTAAYGQFLPSAFLRIPRFGTLNLHPSLLPAWRGAAPVQRALEAGVNTTGITLLFSTLRMDAGPIVAQQATQVAATDDSETLLQRLFAEGAGLLTRALAVLRDQGLPGLTIREQDEGQATLAPKLAAHEAFIDVRELDAVSIVNKIRAFTPWPGVKLKVMRGTEAAECRVVQASALDAQVQTEPGRAWFEGDALLVSCKSGATVLRVTQVQFAGKRVMTAAEVRNGWPAGQAVKLAL